MKLLDNFKSWLSGLFRPGKRVRNIALGAAGILTIVALTAYAIYIPKIPTLHELRTLNRSSAITFLSWKGDVIGSRGGRHTKALPLDEMPEHLKNAFLVTEDKRFYNHGGVDLRGIARALFVNVTSGGVVQGGSTITQQLAKNIFFTHDRTLTRKVKEVFTAWRLENRLTKDEILELYLNRIYLGGGAYGVEAASQTFFDKSAREITIAEAAMLAGLAKAPSRYAPTTSMDRAQERSMVVIRLLRENDMITQEDFDELARDPAMLADSLVSSEINYFLDFASWQVAEIVGDVGVDLVVQTTLDPTLQTKAESALKTHMDQLPEESNAGQAAMVSLATDGAVRAMIGGRNYAQSQFNRAVQAYRQPGSSFKPFVYLTAMKKGMRPDTVYEDRPVKIGDWSPENYTGSYRGAVTITSAMENSLNTVAVRVLSDVGVTDVIETAQQLGFTGEFSKDLTLALGSCEVTLLELTAAYVPFATSGLKMSPYVIQRVETNDGLILHDRTAPDAERVFDQSVASDMNFMMYQVMQSGTGRRANLGARPSAGKTGTSQEWRDAWFLGYTGDLVTGVWVGNDDNTPMNRITGGGLPALIWKDYMSSAHEGWAIAQLPGAYGMTQQVSYNQMQGYFLQLQRKFSEVQRTSARGKRRNRVWSIFN